MNKKKKVSCFAYDVIVQAISSGSQFYELTAFADTLPILTTGSYMTYYNNILWVGAYHATETTNVYGNYLYNVFASCQYAKCIYKVDRVVAVKLTKLQ